MHVLSFLPFAITLLLSIFFWLLAFRVTNIGYFDASRFLRHVRQAIRVTVGVIVIIAVILSLPVTDSVRGQIVTLIGIVISGVFAFASSSVIANFMAGLMLRINRPFSTGDFIQVQKHFGRVIELGAFESKIQSEHSTIIAFPNTYLISNPIEVTPPDSAIVSVDVSLGYDVHHDVIEPLLIAAAKQIGLNDCFTQILSLGDFSISYRVSGVLIEVNKLLSTHSELHRAVLDSLHQADIEIVSPNFMNQPPIGASPAFIPTKAVTRQISGNSDKIAESVVFSKAEAATLSENRIEKVTTAIKMLNEALQTEDDEIKRHAIRAKIDRLDVIRTTILERNL